MMPPADRIQVDPGLAASCHQDNRADDFLAISPALRILQLKVEGLSASKRSVIANIADRQNIDVICLQETHVNADISNRFNVSGFDLISYNLHARHGRALYVRNSLVDVPAHSSTAFCDIVKVAATL